MGQISLTSGSSRRGGSWILKGQWPVYEASGDRVRVSHTIGTPVVRRRVVSIFERLGLQTEVQFIPVEGEGQAEPWSILNALQVIRCIDDARCK